MILTCKSCGANDAIVGGLCLPCDRDRVAAERARVIAVAQAMAVARRWRGKPPPAYAPEGAHGHGLGTEHLAARVRRRRKHA
jgi:hypothetical protein